MRDAACVCAYTMSRRLAGAGVKASVKRLLYQGWSKAQALDELPNGGYGYHAMWKNISAYLGAVDVDKIRRLLES